MSIPGDVDLTDERKRVYRYVERHGPVEPSTVAESVGVDPESFQHHLSILQRDDLLEEDEAGRLRERLSHGEAEEFREAGVSYTIRPARPADFSGVVGAIRAVAGAGTDIVAENVGEQIEYEETLSGRRRRSVGWCSSRPSPTRSSAGRTSPARRPRSSGGPPN